jgi:hypothetical protein
MPKQNTEPSSDPTLTEIKMFPRKLFYAHYAIRILEEKMMTKYLKKRTIRLLKSG